MNNSNARFIVFNSCNYSQKYKYSQKSQIPHSKKRSLLHINPVNLVSKMAREGLFLYFMAFGADIRNKKSIFAR